MIVVQNQKFFVLLAREKLDEKLEAFYCTRRVVTLLATVTHIDSDVCCMCVCQLV